jgi:small-conductance mechanosensitive channel
MFGTELSQAYDEGMNYEPHNTIHMNNSDVEHTDVEQKQPTQQSHPPPKEEIVYETNNFFNNQQQNQPNQMQNQLYQLQEELQKQKNQKQDHSILDRFVSKKKEVFKLVLISLTILLAFSLHYLVNDLLKTYLMNNIMTPSQEFFTKLAYPISILLLIWTIKVFNK